MLHWLPEKLTATCILTDTCTSIRFYVLTPKRKDVLSSIFNMYFLSYVSLKQTVDIGFATLYTTFQCSRTR